MSSNAKIVTGTLIAIVLGLFVLISVMMLVVLTISTIGEEEFVDTLVTWMFCIGLFSFGLSYGLRLRQMGKLEKDAGSIIPSAFQEIKFKTSLTIQEYRSLMIKLMLKKPVILYFCFLGLFLLVGPLVRPGATNLTWILGMIFLLTPFSIVISAGNNYRSTPFLQQELTGEANSDGLVFKGDSYSGSYKWTAIVRVKEISGWFLLYVSPNSFFPINKKHIEAVSFRSFLKGIPGLKCDLKK